jgi:replication fork clamp-binding protein CrfC
MASHIEMKRLSDDLDAVHRLVQFLQTVTTAEWTEWELNFLDSLQLRKSKDPLSLRQTEKLIELRDAAQTFSRYEGYSIKTLISSCHSNALDLADDEDVAFIERLKAENPATLKRRPLFRLVRCARELDIIHDYAATG